MFGRAPLLAARAARFVQPKFASVAPRQNLLSSPLSAARAFSTQSQFMKKTCAPGCPCCAPKPVIQAKQPQLNQRRAFSMWRLRPYAHSGVNLGATSLLAPGYSQVTMTALTVSILPSALFIAPAVMFASALTRLFAEPKHTWTHVYHAVVQFALGFIPVPCYENLFSEMTFYAMTLFFMCTIYQLFPELMLNDFIIMHFLAMFTVSLLPICWSFMPLMNSRAYLTMPCA